MRISVEQVKHRKIVLLTIFFTAALVFALLLSSFHSTNLVYAQAKLAGSQRELAKARFTIHRYSAPPHDQVNSYWIETDEGVIIIEAQRFLSQARYLSEEIRATTDKPLLGIFITHHHTDHIGGLPALVEAFGPDIPIYASQFVRDDIATDGSGFLARRKALHGNDFPAPEDIPLPNQIIEDGDTISIGGLNFEVIEFQDNESPVSTLYSLPTHNALFVGDFVTNQRVPFLRNQQSMNWITQLRELGERYPDQTIYSGHGEPDASQPLISAQIEYIETVRSLVIAALSIDEVVSPEEKTNILAELEQQYPDRQITLLAPGFLERNIDAVAEELTSGS